MLDKKTLLYLMSKMRKRDSQTHEHSYSAAGYAVECARYMHLPKDVIRRLYYGMLLHDIGKTQISLDILNKKEVLTKKERWKIEKHPEYGHAIVTKYNPHKDILDIILYHHERWDGEGYPHKLKGEEIPFLARIAAVADAYDAIVSNRPYKKAVTPEEAIQEIIDHAGTQFDPQIADNFCRSFEKRTKRQAAMWTVNN